MTNQGPTGGALATAGGLVFQGGGSSQEIPRIRCEDGREAVEHADANRGDRSSHHV